MANNTSNNDTMCEAWKDFVKTMESVLFNAQWACVWCMPYTTHITAIMV